MLVLLPEAEGEEVDAVMTEALGSMASRCPGNQPVSLRPRRRKRQIAKTWSAEPCYVGMPERAMRRTKLFRPGSRAGRSSEVQSGRQDKQRLGAQKVDPCCTSDAARQPDCEQG